MTKIQKLFSINMPRELLFPNPPTPLQYSYEDVIEELLKSKDHCIETTRLLDAVI